MSYEDSGTSFIALTVIPSQPCDIWIGTVRHGIVSFLANMLYYE